MRSRRFQHTCWREKVFLWILSGKLLGDTEFLPISEWIPKYWTVFLWCSDGVSQWKVCWGCDDKKYSTFWYPFEVVMTIQLFRSPIWATVHVLHFLCAHTLRHYQLFWFIILCSLILHFRVTLTRYVLLFLQQSYFLFLPGVHVI